MLKILLFLSALLIAAKTQAAEFHGFQCTKDCSGHRAGYEWAERKSITSQEGCRGRSNSFIEGCYAWVNRQKADRIEEKLSKDKIIPLQNDRNESE